MLRELSVVEQRYQAVLAVIRDGVSIVEVAHRFDVSRQAIHRWLRWYEDQGLPGLADRSHRPPGCSHQMDPAAEVCVLEPRRRNPDWGARRLVHEMARATSRAVCAHFASAMRRHGVPQEVLTDNGKVFTGRFGIKDVEVLFDRICRENGIDHLLTAPRRPTTTGKIERFHRTLRQEFLLGRLFTDLPTAQAELDRWVQSYNAERPHSALSMATPASRFVRTD